jgi:hypothetical protein
MLQLGGGEGLTLKGDSPGNKSPFCHLLHIMVGGSRKLVNLQALPCKLDGCKKTLHESLTRPEDMKKTSQKKLPLCVCVCVVEEALGTKVRKKEDPNPLFLNRQERKNKASSTKLASTQLYKRIPTSVPQWQNFLFLHTNNRPNQIFIRTQNSSSR